MATAITPHGRALGAKRMPPKHHPLIGIHTPTLADIASLPPAVDNSDLCRSVGDQEQEGSCTGWAHTGLFYACQIASGQDPYEGAAAFNYYMARKRIGEQGQDNGADPQDNLASLVDEGLPAEHDMPYVSGQYAVSPTAKQFFDAKHHRLIGAALVAQDSNHLKSVIAARRVFTFAIVVYSSFENAANGDIPLPNPNGGDQYLGGHDLFAFGYADDPEWPGGGYFNFQNQWGLSFGNGGRGRIPYAFLTNPDLAYTFTTGTGVHV